MKEGSTMHRPLPLVTPSTGGRRTRFGSHAWSDAARAALRDERAPAVSGEVGFDDASRALYATAGSNYRQVPLGVVIPRTIDDIVATVAACRAHGAPLL